MHDKAQEKPIFLKFGCICADDNTNGFRFGLVGQHRTGVRAGL